MLPKCAPRGVGVPHLLWGGPPGAWGFCSSCSPDYHVSLLPVLSRPNLSFRTSWPLGVFSDPRRG